MSTIDQQFVEYVVKSLVGYPDDVIVDRIIDEKGVLLTLTVNPEDLGRVIGRRGATAQSLRTLLRALGTKNSARYNLKIVNNDEEGEFRSPESSAPTSSSDDTDVVTSEEPVQNTTDEPVEKPAPESSLAKKTRAELAELDDLDI
ncbi:MAG: KH domain-containing protein [Candidatus Saccharimonadaceae bacterium]